MLLNVPISGVTFALAFVISFFLSWLIIRYLVAVFERKRQVPGLPRAPRNTSGRAVMSFGGLGIVLSLFATLWLLYAFGMLPSEYLYLLIILSIGVGMIFALGICDDIFQTCPREKLFVQILTALLFFVGDFKIMQIGEWHLNGALSLILTCIWVIGMCNAVNLIDGQDGLAGGIIGLSCFTLFLIYFERDMYAASFLSLSLAGGVLAFSLFNFPPAKIIMGDTGSLPLGLLVALITLLPVSQGYTDEIYYLIPVVALLYPILDVVYSFSRRVLNNKNPFKRDEEHFHHRLIRLGMSPRQTLLILVSIGAYFSLWCLIPIFFINLIPKFMPKFFVFVVVNIGAFILKLKKMERDSALRAHEKTC